MVLVAVGESEAVLGELARAESGAFVPAIVVMEVAELEALEQTPDARGRVWRLVLRPAGETGERLIRNVPVELRP